MPDWSRLIKRGSLVRRVEATKENPLCIIAVEGNKTEPRYFRKLGVTKIKVVILSPPDRAGNEPTDVLAQIRNYARDNQIDSATGDKCWIVFDVDHRSNITVAAVCKAAIADGFGVAVSNPCFEYWLFLHRFDASDLDPALVKAAARQRPRLMKQMVPTDLFSLDYWEFLTAARDACRRSGAQQSGRKSEHPVFPGTDVHKVVETLL